MPVHVLNFKKKNLNKLKQVLMLEAARIVAWDPLCIQLA